MTLETDDTSASPATRAAAKLAERELERLKAELDVIKAGNHPQRRALIANHVLRIDERQDALDRLRAPSNGDQQP